MWYLLHGYFPNFFFSLSTIYSELFPQKPGHNFKRF